MKGETINLTPFTNKLCKLTLEDEGKRISIINIHVPMEEKE